MTSVILLAGGTGTRMKSPIPKQFLLLKGKPIALYSFEVFCSMPDISELVVVCSSSYSSLFQESFSKQNRDTISLKFAEPGIRRQDSVYNGLQSVHLDSELVCIHDAARPLITKNCVEKVLEVANEHGASALALKAKNTIKECNDNAFVIKTPDRAFLWEMQTPQVLRQELLRNGFTYAIQKSLTVTDDVMFAELLNHSVKLVEGSANNIKITEAKDLLLAEILLNHI